MAQRHRDYRALRISKTKKLYNESIDCLLSLYNNLSDKLIPLGIFLYGNGLIYKEWQGKHKTYYQTNKAIFFMYKKFL